MHVFHPMGVCLAEALRNKLDFALVDNANSILCQRRHLNEPLCRGHRLYRGTAAIAGADIMGMILNLDQTALCFQICQNCLAALIAIHALILAAVFIDGCILIEHENLLQIMALTHLKVIRVVARRGLYTTGAKFLINIIIGKNRNLTADNRQNCHLANQMLVALILRIDSDAAVAHEGLRTGGSDNHALVRVLDVVLDIPQLARLGLILYFGIRQRRCTVRTPVDDAAALVNQALVVQVDKHFLDSLRAAFIHRKALSAPVTGGTQLLELLDDAVTVLVLPRPYALQELLTAEVVTGQTLFLAQVFLYLNLGSDACVVCARHPQRRVALHALGTNQNILQGFVKRVTHMQLTGYIRRRNNNRKRLFVFVYFCIEVALFFPRLVQLVFCRRRVIRLWQFVGHKIASFLV